MLLTTRAFLLAVPLAGLLFDETVIASPRNGIDVSNFGLIKRQDPGPGGGSVDPSGIEPEDEAVNARSLYTNQPTATWYQVSTGTDDKSASFTSFATSKPDSNDILKPGDSNQVRGPNPWNVDHIFELQVIGEAFKSPRPSKIPASAWDSASSAVFTPGPSNAAIASAVTNLKNLQGIPNALNSFKKQVFTGNLTGKGGPSVGDGATFNFFGPAVQKYLIDNKQGLISGTVDDTGNKIQSAANGNTDVKKYFTDYASLHYQGYIDFLSTWSGKPAPASSTSATSSSSTGATAVTCYHAADPRNTCAAITNGPGWCECGNDPATYAVMSSTAPQPCGWTTTPPTTSFDCSTKPTSTCVVPAGCTNEAARPGCAVACT